MIKAAKDIVINPRNLVAAFGLVAFLSSCGKHGASNHAVMPPPPRDNSTPISELNEAFGGEDNRRKAGAAILWGATIPGVVETWLGGRSADFD